MIYVINGFALAVLMISWSDVVKKSIQPDVHQLKHQVEDMKNHTTSIAESLKDIVNATIEKIEDRNNCCHNFIIFNLPENESKQSDDKSSLTLLSPEVWLSKFRPRVKSEIEILNEAKNG